MPNPPRRARLSEAEITISLNKPREFNVGTSLRNTFRLMQLRLQEIFQEKNIPVSMFYFLFSLLKEDGITQRELGDRVGIMGPGTVEQLRRMEDRGLIARVPSNVDRRKVHVFLTPEGRDLAVSLLPLADRNNSTALRGFSAAEKKTLKDFLSRIRENMNAEFAEEAAPTRSERIRSAGM